MLQINKFHINTRAIQLIACLGGGSLLMALFCTFSPIKLPIFFASIPLFVAYLSFGEVIGLSSTMLASVGIALFVPIQASSEIILNIFAPAAVLGHFSIKSITKGRKTWWYPESFLLRNFMLLSLFSVVALSMTFCTEQTMTEASQAAMDLLLSNGKGNNDINAIAIKQYLAFFVKYSVGISVIMKMMFSLLNFQLGHLISKRLKKNIRPEFDFSNIRIGNMMILLPLVSLTLSYIFPRIEFILCGIFVVSLFAPIISGLSLIHCFYTRKHKRRILIAYYLALFMMPIPMLFGTALLGIVDGLYPIRQRIKG